MDKNMYDNSKDALAHIMREHGADVLLSSRLKNFFNDYAPGMKKSRKNVIFLVPESGATEILKRSIGAGAEEQEIAFRQAVQKVIGEYPIERSEVESVMLEFTAALGWKVNIQPQKQQTSPDSEEKQIQTPPTSQNQQTQSTPQKKQQTAVGPPPQQQAAVLPQSQPKPATQTQQTVPTPQKQQQTASAPQSQPKPKPTSKLKPSVSMVFIRFAVLATVFAVAFFIFKNISATKLSAGPVVTPSGTVFTPSVTDGCVTFTGNTAVTLAEAEVGDTVQFGSYEQDNDSDNGKEVIEWFVLDKQDGKLLLLSKDALDCKKYDEMGRDVTWERCTLRSWLNGEFYSTAFSQTEQEHILMTKVKNEGNPEYGTKDGNDTEDKVFLLSIGEVLNYFHPDPAAYEPARRTKVTEYAKAQGAWVSSSGYAGYDGNGLWWLRSLGGSERTAAGVNDRGGLSLSGRSVYSGDIVVRPALWLNPES